MYTRSKMCGILVVDDEPFVRDILRKTLEAHGFKVWTAGDGVEALDSCSENGDGIALVLLDVKMPRLSGPQTLQRLKVLKPQIPVCFMTGHAGAYQPDELLACGARHLFEKPFHLGDVVRVLSDLTGLCPNRTTDTL